MQNVGFLMTRLISSCNCYLHHLPLSSLFSFILSCPCSLHNLPLSSPLHSLYNHVLVYYITCHYHHHPHFNIIMSLFTTSLATIITIPIHDSSCHCSLHHLPLSSPSSFMISSCPCSLHHLPLSSPSSFIISSCPCYLHHLLLSSPFIISACPCSLHH